MAIDSLRETRKTAVLFLARQDVLDATDRDSGQCRQRQVEPDAGQFRDRVREAIAPQAWVCEGNYARRTFDLRLHRVILRSLMKLPRPDLPSGCSEKLDKAFLGFL